MKFEPKVLSRGRVGISYPHGKSKSYNLLEGFVQFIFNSIDIVVVVVYFVLNMLLFLASSVTLGYNACLI